MVQGMLVNGSLGRVTDFCTTREALQRGIKIGLPEAKERRRWKGRGKASRKGPSTDEDWIMERVPSGKYPVVEFITSAVGPVLMLCVPNTFEVNNAEGEIEAKREQVCVVSAPMRWVAC